MARKWNQRGLQGSIVLAGLQIVFAIAIAATTSLQLDGIRADQFVGVAKNYLPYFASFDPSYEYCVLNYVQTLPPGRVCDFVYITVGFGLAFSLLLGIPAVIFLRKGSRFLDGVAISHSLFAGFWWLVLAITIQIRGGQASDAGYPNNSQRTAVIALTWLEFVFWFFVALLAIVDRIRYKRWKKAKKLTSASEVHFRETHTATQVLSATPIA